MINSLESNSFYTADELTALQELRLLDGTDAGARRRAFAGLMLAPVMELSVRDKMTTPNEFEAIEEYVRRMEMEFELSSKEDIESIGTEMGMLPMVKGTWQTLDFVRARTVLGPILLRMPEAESHAVRNAIAKACLEVARAGGAHLISVHMVDAGDKPLIVEIAHSLKLESTAEGLNLLGKAGA